MNPIIQSKSFFRSLKPNSGMSLLTTIMALGMMGILVATFARMQKSNYQSAKEFKRRSGLTYIDKSLTDSLSCQETINALTPADCTSGSYVTLKTRLPNGTVVDFIPSQGKFYGRNLVRARCISTPTAWGLDIRVAEFIKPSTIPSTSLKRNFNYSPDFRTHSVANKSNFVRHLNGTYLSWTNPKSYLKGPLNSTTNTLPCQDHVNAMINPTAVPAAPGVKVLFGGMYQRRCAAADYVSPSNPGTDFDTYCRQTNTLYPGLGCSCPPASEGWTQIGVSEWCLPQEVAPGQWMGAYGSSAYPGPFASELEANQKSGYFVFLCFKNL